MGGSEEEQCEGKRWEEYTGLAYSRGKNTTRR